MRLSVCARSLHDQRRSLAVWAVALVLLVGMYAGFFPSMHGSSAYNDLIAQLPDAVRNLFTAGIGGDLSSGPGFVYLELLSFLGPTLVLLFAVGTAAQALAGEEERHTLDLLLATPVTRARVTVEKYLAMCAGLVVLVTAMGVALVAFGAAAGMGLSTGNVAAAMLHLALLGAVFGALALAVGAGTGHVAAARGAAAAVAVIAYLVNGFALNVSWLHPVRKVSPFYQFLGHDPIRNGVSGAAVVVAAVTAAALLAVAVATFSRRDLHA